MSPGPTRLCGPTRSPILHVLQGVTPGVHRFKFIVDGRWCADLNGPVEHDFWGNANNVVVVPDGGADEPQPGGVGESRGKAARSATRTGQLSGDAPFSSQTKLGAALLAFYCKMQ